MTTIRALEDGAESGLPLLGELHLIKGAPVGEMRVAKRISIPKAGSYDKIYPAPLYDRQVMEALDRRTGDEWGFGRKRCLGFLAARGTRTLGYVRRRIGLHDLCIPVYDPSRVSPLAWKAEGYLPVGNGYVTVISRRIAYWVWLAVAFLAVFLLSYLVFVQGFDAFIATVRELPQTLSDGWYRLLRDWGMV